jgi:Holliday junction resolvase RusA-like endonuclease
MAAVLRAAAPLHRKDVDNYMQSVADALRAAVDIGDGTVYRAAEAGQRKYFEPPFEGFTGVIKYGR